MNETARQLIADELNRVECEIQDYENDIARLNQTLANKKTKLAIKLHRKAELEEAADW